MPRVTINDSSEQELFVAANPGVVQIGAGSAEIGVVDIADQTMLKLTGTLAVTGPTQIIGGGSGLRIVLSSIMVQNESAVATKVILYEDADAITQALLQTQGASFSVSFPVGREYKLPEGEAFRIGLGGANQHNYTVFYYPETV